MPETLGFPPGDQSRDAALLTERLETQNPHIKSNNQAFRGYGVPECRPYELLCTYRGPASVMVDQSPTMTLARFRVPRDRLEVEVLQGNPNPLGILVTSP